MFKRNTETLSEILGSETLAGAQRGGDLFSSSLLAEPKRHETLRLESADGSSLPSVIVPFSKDTEDFFATVATYYQDQSPLSALVHVLGKETVSLLSTIPDASKEPNSDFRRASLGAALGEAALAGFDAHDASGVLSYSACRRTLAFSLCRASVLYGPMLRADVLAARWARLRKLTGLTVSKAAIDAVVTAHGLAGEDPNFRSNIETSVETTLRALVRTDRGSDELLVRALVDLYPSMEQYLNELQGAFNERMSAFTRLVAGIQGQPRGAMTDDIAIAFACNRILPGSFAHAGVLSKLVDFFPSSLVWYGLLAVFSKPSVTQQLSLGLLAKLDRDLLAEFSFAQRPRCDISLEELEILLRATTRVDAFRSSHQRALLVALFPGVDVYTRISGENDSTGEQNRRNLEMDELHSRVSNLLEEALYTLKKAGRNTVSWTGSRRPRKDR